MLRDIKDSKDIRDKNDIKDNIQLSLFDNIVEKREQQESRAHTIDAIRSRFGHGSLLRASCLLDSSLAGFNPKEDHVIHPVSFFK